MLAVSMLIDDDSRCQISWHLDNRQFTRNIFRDVYMRKSPRESLVMKPSVCRSFSHPRCRFISLMRHSERNVPQRSARLNSDPCSVQGRILTSLSADSISIAAAWSAKLDGLLKKGSMSAGPSKTGIPCAVATKVVELVAPKGLGFDLVLTDHNAHRPP